MTDKHTPGPWYVGEDFKGIKRVFANRSEVVRALSKHGLRTLSPAEREANRSLIAAAPELLEALEWLTRDADQWSGQVEPPLPALANAWHIIAKAKGKLP